MAKVKKLQIISHMFLAIIIVTSLFTPSVILAKPNPKYASIVMDVESGIILSQSNPDKKLHPASLTKIMTLLMVFEEIQNGRLNLNDRVRVSRYAEKMVPSKLDLKAGSSIKVKDAIYALVTKSANDVAVALAEHIGGSEYNFARKMTRRAKQIGMSSTHFTNASGLHDPKQISTARDMAKLGRTLIVNYPYYYRYFSTESFTYRGKTYNNHNRLLGKYPGLDGIKTGYVNASGFNLVASAVRNNRRIIGVVFGGKSGKTRNAHMEALLNTGFSKAKRMRLTNAPTPLRKPGVILQDSQLSVASAQDTYADLNARLSGKAPASRVSPQDVGGSMQSGGVKLKPSTLSVRSSAYSAPPLPRTQNARSVFKKPQLKSLDSNATDWAIQVGAFSSRARSDKALYEATEKLPDRYARATPIIAPLKTDTGWVFRARLSGYTKADAYDACGYINGCMAVAP